MKNIPGSDDMVEERREKKLLLEEPVPPLLTHDLLPVTSFYYYVAVDPASRSILWALLSSEGYVEYEITVKIREYNDQGREASDHVCVVKDRYSGLFRIYETVEDVEGIDFPSKDWPRSLTDEEGVRQRNFGLIKFFTTAFNNVECLRRREFRQILKPSPSFEQAMCELCVLRAKQMRYHVDSTRFMNSQNFCHSQLFGKVFRISCILGR
eukprot:TRINITY_DN9130_c0_g2_i5.p1 TRINITY_DN9130_c0_g2~~TRINITY_DN9130_c0_g2_i5.p1  ORF type:complete len:210 (-),score=35.30 TRINITY_DN9130_c0_g2_i5:510-1139(-)